MKIETVNPKILGKVNANDGYCPCALVKNEDTFCPCKEFRESPVGTVCHCGLFKKTEE